MATVEARNAARLETFLESDGRISATIRQRFDSGALHPKHVLRCLMACAGPDSFILCGAAFWLAAGSIGKLIATNSMARMSAAIISAAAGANTTLITSPAFVRHLKIFFGASLVTAGCAGFRIWSSAKAEVLTVARLKRMLFSSLLEKDISTFDTEGTGELMSRLSSDVTIIGTVLSTNVNLVWQNGFNLLGSMYSLYRLSPRLTMIYVAISAAWVLCTKKFGAYQQALQRRVLGDDAKMSGIVEQSLSMIRLVRYDRENLTSCRLTKPTGSSCGSYLPGPVCIHETHELYTSSDNFS
jgi:ABC-type multidrug transport system fused ATPase/permease subunit